MFVRRAHLMRMQVQQAQREQVLRYQADAAAQGAKSFGQRN